MKKTIKELADELGVSKDKVKYQTRKLPSELTSKIDGVTYLSESAIDTVSLILTGKNTQELPSDFNHQLPTRFIEKELEKKDNEIKEKNKQIDNLHELLKQQQKLLDQQQVLTLQANKKIAELELTVNEEEEKKGEKETPEEVKQETNDGKPKSFFSRLFGR